MFHYILSLLILFEVATCNPLLKQNLVQRYKEEPAVKRLQEYIQIDTSRPENIELSVEFWKRQAEELELPFAVYRPVSLPICVITMRGSQPSLPSIVLNTHADVVPVEEDLWTYPPFSGHIDESGILYGRGAQDTKSNGLHYIEAIRKLLQNNITLDRTMYITVMPDEETGGFKGILPFIETAEFKTMNVGFMLDEGLTSPDSSLYATYVDKRPWQMKFDLRGDGGHSLTMSDENALQKAQKLINVVMEYRSEQNRIKNTMSPNDFGAYTSVNINMLKGSLGPNIVPVRVSLVIDMRLSISAKITEVQAMVDSWLAESGNTSSIEFIRRMEYSPATAVDESNPYWLAMMDVCKDLGINIQPVVCPATSDMVGVRALGIPAIGFATARRMVSKIHAFDEYIPLDNYMEGTDIFVALLKRLGNLPDFP